MNTLKFFLLVIVMASVLQSVMQRDMRSGRLPELPVNTLEGEAVEPLLAKKTTIIYFWGSWCGICEAISGSIDAVFQDYSGVSVALRSGDDVDIQAYLQAQQLDWPVINDNDGLLAESFGVRAVPAVFVVAPDGDIVFSTLGYVTEIGLRARLWWASMDFRR